MLDAYVIGHGIPELAAALELAEVGLRVRVGVPAGLPASQLDTAVLDTDVLAADARAITAPDCGASDPDGVLRAFLAHVAGPIEGPEQTGPEATAREDSPAVGSETLGHAPAGAFAAAEPEACAPSRTLLRGANGDWQPLPEPNVWGVPAVPMSSDSIALLGGRGALRASVDRVRPVLTIGKTTALGTLVRSRMGQQMLDRVVDPLVRARFGVSANDVDVAIAAPGLNGALTVAGSLSGAVLTEAEDHAARETRVRPAGGWQGLRAALIERLALYGVQFGAPVVEAIRLEDAAGGARADSAVAQLFSPHWRVIEHDGEAFDVVAVIAGISARRAVPDALRAFARDAEHALWRATLQAPAAIADLPAGLAAAAAAASEGSGSAGEGSADCDVVAVSSGVSGWSVQYERVARDQWRVTAAGSADAAQGDAGAQLQAVREEHPALAHADVEWQLAPWAQVQARDAAAEELAAERIEHAWQLRVGRGLHAGDLASAVEDARRASVHLRRRLTGISD